MNDIINDINKLQKITDNISKNIPWNLYVANALNDLRDIISRISNSASLSDDEKSKRVDIARERAKERIKAMGLDPDNFNL